MAGPVEPTERKVRTENIGLHGIAVLPNRLRALNPAVVKELAASMKERGQLQPIVIRPKSIGYILVAGRHRYEAARKLKWPSIRAEILDGLDAVKAELAEIDENLMRADLSPAERDLHWARRKALYEEEHPETLPTKEGGPGRAKATRRRNGDLNDRFTKDAAAKTGSSERTIQKSAARAKAIGEDGLREIVGTSLDKPEQLNALAKLDKPERDALIERAAAGENVQATPEVKKPAEPGATAPKRRNRPPMTPLKRLQSAWEDATPEERAAFRAWVEADAIVAAAAE
jgi:ParB-like chromosome segregation protein Spo0J